MVFWGIVVYSVAIRKRKDGFTKMKNKLMALLAVLLLSISLLHTEVYASPNLDSDIPLVVSENVKAGFDAKSNELTSAKKFVPRSGALPHPADPDFNNWSG